MRAGRWPAVVDVRQRSVARGAIVVAVSLIASLVMAGFPEMRRNAYEVIPFVMGWVGTLDTARNMRRRWSWYHGGVVLLLYTDLMVLSMIGFLWLYPYASWMQQTH